MSLREHARQTLSFGVIGTIGFALDGGVLTLLRTTLGVELLPARLCSFAVAVSVTWSLNRRLTFPGGTDPRVLRQWFRYAAVNGIGGLINLAVFLWLVYRFDTMASQPLMPLAIASLVAMVFNFLASKYVAFRQVPA